MGPFDIAIIVFVVVVVIIVAVYFLNKWASRRMVEQNTMIERTKQTVSMYIIDKKHEKMQNANFPKAVMEQLPRFNKMVKMYLVKAKVGPQIMTLVTDKEVFNALQVKKTVKVDLAGIYIVSVKGMKSKEEMAERRGGNLPWYRKILPIKK
ncbi:MAG: hypothetical protein FWG65_07465 [Turicibacter sp.]|nr:hypothetical protein [Turicibacter sp.]